MRVKWKHLINSSNSNLIETHVACIYKSKLTLSISEKKTLLKTNSEHEHTKMCMYMKSN